MKETVLILKTVGFMMVSRLIKVYEMGVRKNCIGLEGNGISLRQMKKKEALVK